MYGHQQHYTSSLPGHPNPVHQQLFTGSRMQPNSIPGRQKSFVPGGMQQSIVGGLQPFNSNQQSHNGGNNDVDTWIDLLEPSSNNQVHTLTAGVGPEVLMAWMVQQYLPKVHLPFFSGSALEWVEFIVKFREVVHNQPYLADTQKIQLLLQHLRGEAKKSVRGYANDNRGYVMALKTLKHLFGQRPAVATAILAKVTRGKNIADYDVNALSDFYYSINDCLVTLKQLNYVSDLYSSDTLRQAVQRLPLWLVRKWSERSLYVRRKEEPNLLHFADWLQDRVLALKESNLSELTGRRRPERNSKAEERNSKPEEKFVNTITKEKGKEVQKCTLCESPHNFWKCQQYKDMDDKKKVEFVKKRKLCFNCFGGGHSVDKCASNNSCFKEGCGKKHHTSLHEYIIKGGELLKANEKDPKNDGKDKNGATNDTKGKDQKNDEVKNYGLFGATPKTVYLMIVPVTLYAKGKSHDTYALLDDCSQATILRGDVAEILGLEGHPTSYNLNTIKDKPEKMNASAVSLSVSARNGKSSLSIEPVYIQPKDKFNMPSRPSLKEVGDVGRFTHLKGLDFEAVSSDQITILIGSDVPEAHIQLKVRKGKKGEPYALQTILGWTLFGSATGVPNPGGNGQCSVLHVGKDVLDSSLPSFWKETESPPSIFVNCTSITPADAAIHKSLERFWDQEHTGILPAKEVVMSCDDVRAMKKMDRETILVDGHYQVPMLWDNSRKKLPDNLPMARKRYHHLEKKLRADKELYTRYKTVIDGYLQQNPPYARLMAPEEVQKRTPKTWILPSFPVFNPNKPGKIRVVKDAAALYQGECLNNNLLTGPDILNSLTGVLLNFRIHKVAVAADIEAMFHQVRVDPTDADSLRFLWKDDITAEGSPQMYQMLVHIFGAKDSPTCANYAVKRTARDNIDKFDPATIETALRAFYVDDLLKSVPSEEMAIWLSKELISLLKSGGFRLTKFSSTSQVVLDALPKSEVSPACTVQIDAEENMHRALGIAFEVTKDLFTFTIEIEEEAPDTKRWILKITASIFDPIGFLTPFILVAKVILQDLWRMGSDWDDLVDGLIKKRWRKWLEGAKKLSRIKIPRRYTTDERQPNEIQLHVFCDASEVAYGCVAYVRFTFKSGEHSCSLVMSKSRLAPIKTVTVPRLELSAARLGARLGHFIRYELDLPVERIQYWSDSTLTMQYLNNNTHRMKVYVANRVTEILDLTKQEEWGHVPGELNTADLLTRGVQDPEELMKSRWPIAPSFLELDEEFWPRLNFDSLDSEDVEIKKKSVLVAIALVETEGIDLTRISNWVRLKRTVGWTLRL